MIKPEAPTRRKRSRQMKLKVEKCLEFEVFKDAQVLAGHKGMDRIIRSISILESSEEDDVEKYMAHSGELVLTGFFSAKDDVDKQVNVIRQLGTAKAAGVCLFYVGSVLKKVDKKVIDEANKHNLALIQLPDRKVPTPGDVITVLMSAIVNEDEFGNRLINNTVSHLLNFEKHSSFHEALREAAIKNEFQIVLLSEDFNPILTVETLHRTTIADAIRLGITREKDVEQPSIYTLLDVNGVLTYWGPINIAGEKHFMFIVDNEDAYTVAEINKLAEVIELAMGMWKYTPVRDAKAEFIKALIRGNKSLAYSLQKEAAIDAKDIVCVFFARGIDKVLGTEVLLAFEAESNLSLIRLNEGEETFGMIVSKEGNEDEDQSIAKMSCVNLFSNLKENKAVRLFHVTGVDGIEGSGDAFRLISESWSFVQSVFPYKRVFTKYELTLVSNCINIQLQGGYVKKNYMELLDVFHEKTSTKGKQLLETLETFVLDAGMNSSKTSEFLGIHTNTVQYRLKKINDLLGAEITGNRVVPGLTIALALKRLERGIV